MISVCLCTYNGEAFLRELLDSLVSQTLLPEEIVVCDDNSTDSTKDILIEYSKQYTNIKWILIFNEINVGWRTNFRNAINSTSGDIIFLCDQDDIWNNNKIKNMYKCISDLGEALLLSCSYEVLYETNDARETISPPIDGRVKRVDTLSCFMNPIRPGCSYCFTKELKEYYLKSWDSSFAHDAMLWRLAFMLDGLYTYNYNGFVFRRHNGNASSFYGSRISLKKYKDRLSGFRMSILCLERIQEIKDWNEKKQNLLRDIKHWYKQRMMAYTNRQVLRLFLISHKYLRFDSLKSLIVDLLLVFKYGGVEK